LEEQREVAMITKLLRWLETDAGENIVALFVAAALLLLFS
jgi:hypothetical protein